MFWTEFTASDIATCIIAMLRRPGIAADVGAFMRPIAVWFQSVITSARAGPATTRLAQKAPTAKPLKNACDEYSMAFSLSGRVLDHSSRSLGRRQAADADEGAPGLLSSVACSSALRVWMPPQARASSTSRAIWEKRRHCRVMPFAG